MYKKVKIKNFRGLSSMEIEDLKQYNLIIGKNNSGKTTILESIFLLTGIANPNLLININSFRNLRLITEYSWSYIFNKMKFNNPIKLIADIKSPDEKRELTIEPITENSISNSGDISSESIKKEIETTPSDKTIGLSMKGLIFYEKDRKPIKLESSLKIVGKDLEKKFPEKYTESIRGIFIHSSHIIGDNAKRFSDILIRKQEKEIIKILQKVEPAIQNITLGSENVIYCDIGYKSLIPINVIGGGINRLLSMILAIYDASDGVVLIDEVENGFHYSILEMVWQAIFESAKRFNVQVLATTHSYETIKAYNMVSQRIFKDADESNLLRIEREDDLYNLVKINSEVLETTLEHNLEVR